jgi:hypothetical protein
MYCKTIFFFLLLMLLSCKKFDNERLVEAKKTGYDISDESFENAGLSILLQGESEWKNYKAEFVNFNVAFTEMKITLTDVDYPDQTAYITLMTKKAFKNKTYYVNEDHRILTENDIWVKLVLKMGKMETEYTGNTDTPINYVVFDKVNNDLSCVNFNYSGFTVLAGSQEIGVKGRFLIRK